MGLFDKVESKVGASAKNIFSKFGRRDLKPVDFVVALKEELDTKAVEVGHDRKVGPNQFRIFLSTADFDKIESWGPQELANELAGAVSDHGAAEEYAFIGPINVIFEEETENEAGEFQIESEAVKPETDESSSENKTASPIFSELPETSQTPLSSTHPSIELGGKRYVLIKEVTVIGRGSDCDIILEDSAVSRHHLEIKVTPQGTIAQDMGSANGMFVEGHQIQAATLLSGNTLTIGKTRIVYWEPESAPDFGA